MLAVYTVLKQGLSGAMFRILLTFAQKCGGYVPDSQQSSTVFDECRDLVVQSVSGLLRAAIHASPYYAISVDEKDAFLIVVVSFHDNFGQKIWAPLAYKHLPGFEAPDLFATIKSTMEEFNLDPAHLVAFCADGASVMGTRRALSDSPDGNNVARRLQVYAGHPILVQHCGPHRYHVLMIKASQV